MKPVIAFICLGTLTALSFQSHAAEEDSDLPDWAEERVEPFRANVGNWVDNTSRNIDAFFGGGESATVNNESYLRLGQEIDWMEGDGTSSLSDFPLHREILTTVIAELRRSP